MTRDEAYSLAFDFLAARNGPAVSSAFSEGLEAGSQLVEQYAARYDKDAGGHGSFKRREGPGETDAQLSRLAQLGQTLTGAARSAASAVRDKVVGKFQQMEARYGRAGAIAVMSAALALTPVPLPGTSFLPVGIAEAILAVGKLTGRYAAGEAMPDTSLTPEQIQQLAQQLLAEVQPAEPVAQYAASEQSSEPVLVLWLYRGDEQEPIELPLGSVPQWEQFATWAAEQGGELGRLALQGHTDEHRGAMAIRDLRQQLTALEDAPVPEIAERLLAGLTDDVQGVVVTPAETRIRQQATSPMPPTSTTSSAGANAPKVHRDAFRYREAEDDGPRCRTCLYYRDRDSEVGDCQLYQALTKSQPEKYALVTVVAPEMVCEAWEQRPEEVLPPADENLSSASGTLFG